MEDKSQGTSQDPHFSGSHSSAVFAAAMKLVSWFFAVFPIWHSTKIPAVKTGFKVATTDPEQITKWFTGGTPYNLGVATGSASGVWVLDIDVKEGARGFESLAELEAKNGPLPKTLTCTTPSGGQHFYFKFPVGSSIRNRTALLPGIDVRGEGGYVLVPPSVFAGGSYTWDDESVPVADAPIWLQKYVVTKQKALPSVQAAEAATGGRNDAIFTAANEQMRKGHPIEVVTDFMQTLNVQMCKPPLNEAEVKQIVDNVFRLYAEQSQANMTDLGRAQRMAAMHDGVVKFMSSGEWLKWTGHLWERVKKNSIVALAKDLCKRLHMEADSMAKGKLKADMKENALYSESRRGIDDMLTLLESEDNIYIPADVVDTHKFIFPVKNGMVNLETGAFSAGDPALLMTHGSSVEFDASAKCPRWEEFLLQVMRGDSELVKYLQRAIGYSMTGSTREHCLFFMYGYGANGKSTFLNILRALFGDLGTQSAAETFLDGKRSSSGPSGDLARLHGIRFIAASEMDDGKFLAEALVKALTSGDAITARHLFGRDFTFIPVGTYWLASNYKPTIRGNDNGIWRRMRIIPFEATFTPEQQDKMLEDKLMAEQPGILNWAIAGCLDWQKNGLPTPSAIKNATSDYREEMDIPGRWLKERCLIGEEYEVPFSEAYSDFQPWALENHRLDFSAVRFAKMLKERGFTPTARPQRGYRGFVTRSSIAEWRCKKYDAHLAFMEVVKAICSMNWPAEERSEGDDGNASSDKSGTD